MRRPGLKVCVAAAMAAGIAGSAVSPTWAGSAEPVDAVHVVESAASIAEPMPSEMNLLIAGAGVMLLGGMALGAAHRRRWRTGEPMGDSVEQALLRTDVPTLA